MPDYVVENEKDSAAGLVLLGSFLTRKYKTGTTSEGRPQIEYPVPSLTVGGELDGLCRISRITEALYSQVTFSNDPKQAVVYMPVTIIPGMNHMEFASGEIPKFVKDNDLQAEISEEEAQEKATYDIGAFLNSIVFPNDDSYRSIVVTRVDESQEFSQPITDALLMEGYEQFLPPCYCEAEDEYGGLQYGTCVDTPSCNGGVDWTGLYSQVIMAGLNNPEVSGLKVVATVMHFY